jgi:carboxypeptidase-like protein
MRLFSLLILMLFTGITNAQQVSGTIRDQQSKEPIAYVNIGVVNKNTGTVSDVDGHFTIALTQALDSETIKISMVGYTPQTMKVSDFVSKMGGNPEILLERNVSGLKEVVVKRKKLQTGTLGNIPAKKTESAGFEKNILGNEMGVVIKLKRKPAYIKAFHAMVDFNRYRELKFRLNFYDVKDGLPNNSILSENIIVTSEIKRGQLDVDLTDYNLWAEGDFFVSIELIEEMGEGGLHFLADYKGTPVITRAASQGKWNTRNDGLSFGFWVTAAY